MVRVDSLELPLILLFNFASRPAMRYTAESGHELLRKHFVYHNTDTYILPNISLSHWKSMMNETFYESLLVIYIWTLILLSWLTQFIELKFYMANHIWSLGIIVNSMARLNFSLEFVWDVLFVDVDSEWCRKNTNVNWNCRVNYCKGIYIHVWICRYVYLLYCLFSSWFSWILMILKFGGVMCRSIR